MPRAGKRAPVSPHQQRRWQYRRLRPGRKLQKPSLSARVEAAFSPTARALLCQEKHGGRVVACQSLLRGTPSLSLCDHFTGPSRRGSHFGISALKRRQEPLALVRFGLVFAQMKEAPPKKGSSRVRGLCPSSTCGASKARVAAMAAGERRGPFQLRVQSGKRSPLLLCRHGPASAIPPGLQLTMAIEPENRKKMPRVAHPPKRSRSGFLALKKLEPARRAQR